MCARDRSKCANFRGGCARDPSNCASFRRKGAGYRYRASFLEKTAAPFHSSTPEIDIWAPEIEVRQQNISFTNRSPRTDTTGPPKSQDDLMKTISCVLA